MKKMQIAALVLILFLLSCGKNPVIEENMLDGDVIFDATLYDPDSVLISLSHANPSAADLSKPVIIAAHGYTATTFEWQEFRDWADGHGDILVSQVLLGGHGLDYESFKASTWEDWRAPILAEYQALHELGFTNINLIGSSTGCPLIVKLLADDAFKNYVTPNEVFLVDPMVIPSNKLLSIISVVGPMLGYTETEVTDGTRSYWYTFRPQETLQELMEVASVVRVELEDGIQLPENTQLKVYKSSRDASADPIGAVMLYKGMELSDGGKIDVEMYDSDLHVMTRLAAREDLSQADMDIQLEIFEDVRTRVLD